MASQSVPDGHHTVTPYLTVRDALKVIDFLKSAFGAEVTHEPLKRPDGKIMHAEVKIGDSRVMIAEESEMAARSTVVLKPSASRCSCARSSVLGSCTAEDGENR